MLVAWDMSRAMAKLQLQSTFVLWSFLTSLGCRLIVSSLRGIGRAAPLLYKAVLLRNRVWIHDFEHCVVPELSL